MKVTTLDKIALLGSMYSVLNFLPNLQKKVTTFFRPIDTTRYFEFGYLRKFIKKNKLTNLNILDVSSPHMMAYYLSKNNKVIKTNIDIDEKKFIKENNNLTFRTEDATNMSFPDDTFDLVYSISVIEHIYGGYLKAISEMLRVTKKGGYVYLTFPVAEKHKEDWLTGHVYSHQFSKDGKTFFYYRFNEEDVKSILDSLVGFNVVHKDIFWEKKNGLVDNITDKLNYKSSNKYLTFIKDIIVNNYYGFTMFPNEPTEHFLKGKLFGIIHIVLKKE